MFSFLKKSRDEHAHKRLDSLHSTLDKSFSKIKDDINDVGGWIKTLDIHREDHVSRIEDIDSRLRLLEEAIQEMNRQKEFVEPQQLSKHKQTVVRPKQVFESVQTTPTAVQTTVQTDMHSILVSLTPMERTVAWALLNTDLKLSYTDLSNLLGKDESTVRGQVTNIKRKVPGLINELNEGNGKKRFNISESIRERILAQYAQKKAKKSQK